MALRPPGVPRLRVAHNFQQIFNVSLINLSTAVWVGFLALFRIATDDGVVMSTYLRQWFGELKPKGTDAIRRAVVDAGKRRIRPCLMTTATTLLALLPVLTSTGRGSGLMAPMAVPIFGGMLIELIRSSNQWGLKWLRFEWWQQRPFRVHLADGDMDDSEGCVRTRRGGMCHVLR